jgi:glucose/arabinose dehydrogenase
MPFASEPFMRARLQAAAISLGVLVSFGLCFFLITQLALSREFTPGPSPTPEPTVALSILQQIRPEAPPHGVEVEVVAADLDRPVAFAIAPDGRIFFTEKETGNVRVIVNDRLWPQPVLTLPVATSAEQGLLGIAVDPDFASNHYIWVYHSLAARDNNGEKVNRIVRFVERDNAGIDATPVFTSPNSEGDGTHNAGNLHFGPDGKLYVSIGEDNQAALAQRLDDPRGKILRFNPTAPLSAPDDNPFYDGSGPNFDAIYSYGHRNPFDFTFDPLGDGVRIFVSENGPGCDDEINFILPGYNYGWYFGYTCEDEKGLDPTRNTIPPMLFWTPPTAPAGITIYTGDDIPEWHGDVFFCSYLDATLHHLKLNAARDAFVSHSAVNGMFCQTAVFTGPEGGLYFVEGGGFEPGTLKRLVRRGP